MAHQSSTLVTGPSRVNSMSRLVSIKRVSSVGIRGDSHRVADEWDLSRGLQNAPICLADRKGPAGTLHY
jgi:hypothetical protein